MNPISDLVDISLKGKKETPKVEQQLVDTKCMPQQVLNYVIEQPYLDAQQKFKEKIFLLDQNQKDDEDQFFSEESDQIQITQQLIQKVNPMTCEDRREPLKQQAKYILKEQQAQNVQNIQNENRLDQLQNEQLREEKVNNKVFKQELKQADIIIQITQSQKIEQPIMQQKQPDQSQKQSCPYPKPLQQIQMPYGMKHFLLNPPQKGGMIQCTITRDKVGMNRLYPEYHMYISKEFSYLMSAKKQTIKSTGKSISNFFQYLTRAKKKLISNNYIVSMAKEDINNKQNYLGKVKSNSLGTESILYDQGDNPKKCQDPNQIRQQLGVVNIQNNQSEAPRKIKVIKLQNQIILPKVDEVTNQIHVYKPHTTLDGIFSDINQKNENNYVVYQNKPPQWNEQWKAHILNFYGRGSVCSKMNFQFILEKQQDNIILQMAKDGDNLFNVDFQWPITPLQAFQIALTCFD